MSTPPSRIINNRIINNRTLHSYNPSSSLSQNALNSPAASSPALSYSSASAPRSRLTRCRSIFNSVLQLLSSSTSPTDFSYHQVYHVHICTRLVHRCGRLLTVLEEWDSAIVALDEAKVVADQQRVNGSVSDAASLRSPDSEIGTTGSLSSSTTVSLPPQFGVQVEALINVLRSIGDFMQRQKHQHAMLTLINRSAIEAKLASLLTQVRDVTTQIQTVLLAKLDEDDSILYLSPTSLDAVDMSQWDDEDGEDRAEDINDLEDRLQELLDDDFRILGYLDLKETEYVEAMEAFQAALSKTVDRDMEKLFMQRALNALKRAVATLKTTHHLPVPEPEVHDWTITSWEVEMLNPIARGGFGEVLRGVWLGHVDVAVKRLHMKLDTTRVRQDFLREVRAWYPLRHPNVLELLGACASAERPFMISPLMTGGHALQYLERHPVSASRSLKLLYEIALGMSYLHSRRVIHADLKAINVLVDGNGRAVVADFGFAVLKKVTTTQSTSTMGGAGASDGPNKNRGGMAGTLRWMSPERLQGGKPTVYVDIYAFAMTCFEVLSRGDIPFSDIPDPLIYSSVVLNHVRPSRPTFEDEDDASITGIFSTDSSDAMGGASIVSECSGSSTAMSSAKQASSPCTDTVWNLVTACWNSDPMKRPQFASITTTLQMALQAAEAVERFSSTSVSIPTSPVMSGPSAAIPEVARPLALAENRPQPSPKLARPQPVQAQIQGQIPAPVPLLPNNSVDRDDKQGQLVKAMQDLLKIAAVARNSPITPTGSPALSAPKDIPTIEKAYAQEKVHSERSSSSNDMYISGNSVLSEKVVIVAPQSISEVSPEYVVGAVITIDASAETSKKGKEPLIGLAIASPPPNTGWYGLDLPGKATARVVKSRPPSPQPLHIPYTPLPTPPTTLGTPPARSAPLATPPQPPALPAPPAPPATPAPPSAPANHAPVPPTAPPLPTPQTTMAMVLDAVGQNTTASTVARTVMERLGLDTHAPEEHNESRLNQLARPDVWEGLRNGLSEAYTAYMDRNGGGVDGSMIADVAREIEEVLRRNMKSVGIAVGPQTLEVGPPPHPPANGAPVPPVTRTVKVEVEPMFGVPTQVVRSAESTDDALRFWRTYWPESAPAHARSIADVLDDTAMPLRTFFEHLETYIGHACNRGAVNRVVDVRGDSHVRARDLVRLLGSFSSLKGAVEALEMRKDGFYEEEDDSLPPPYESAEHFHHPANVAGVPPAPEIGSKETAEQRSVYCEQRSDENERASSTPRQLPQSNGVPSFNAAELYALSEAQRNALEIQAQSLEKVQRAMEQMQRREHEHQAGMFGNATRTLEQMQRWEQGNQSSPYGQGFQGWSWGPGLQPMYGDGIGPMPPMPSVPPIPSVPDVSININYTEGRPPVVAMGRGGSVRPPMGRGGMSNPMGFLPRPPTFNVPMQLPFWSSAARPILPMNVPGQPVPNSPREGKFSPTRYWRNVKTYKEEEHPAYLSFWVQYFGSAVKTNWGKFFKKFCQESYDLNPFDEEYWFKRFCETEEQGPSSASVSMTSTSSGSSVGSSSLPIIHGRRSRHTAVTLTRFLAKLPKSIQLSVDDSMSPYVSSKADEGVAVTWADFIDEMVRQKAWTVDTMLDISSIRSYLVEGSWASDRIVYDNMGDVGSLADQAALLIANELKRNGTVKEVTIRPNNGLTDFGVIALAEALRVNFRVEKVDISGNTDLTKVAVRVIDRVLTRENLCVREVLFYDCELRFHASKVQCYNRVKWERRRGKGKRGRGRRDSRRHWHHDRHHFGDGSTSLKNKYSRSTIESDPSVDGSDGDSNSSGNNNTESNDEVSEIDYTSGGDMQAMMLRAREQEARINSKLAVIDSEMGQLGMQEESLKMGLHRVAGDAAQEEVMRVSLDGLREAKERMQFQHAVCESKLDQVRDNLQTLMVLIESTVGSTAASSSGVSGGGSGSTGPPTVERKWSAGEIERPVVVRRAEHALPPAVSKARTLPEEGLSNGIRRSASSDAPRVGRTSSADTERGGGGIWANLFKPKEDPSRTASTTPEPSSSTSTPPPSLPAKMISREALAAGGQTDTPLPLQWLGKALAFMNGQGGQTVVTVADAAPTSSSSATSTPTAATTTTTDTAAGHAKSDIEDTTASNAMRENEEDECERDVSEHYEAGREGLYPPSRTGGSVAT